MYKKLISIILITILLLFLVACSKQQEPEVQIVYAADFISFPDNYGALLYAKQSDANTVWTVWRDAEGYSVRFFDPGDAIDGMLVLNHVTSIDNDHRISGFTITKTAVTLLFQTESDFMMTRINIDGITAGSERLDHVFSLGDEPDIRITAAITDSNDHIYVAWMSLRQAQKACPYLQAMEKPCLLSREITT